MRFLIAPGSGYFCSLMPRTYEKSGIHFLYPDNWLLEEETAAPDELSVSVYGPQGAFWSLSVQPADTDPAELADTALKALQEEYAQSESEPMSESVAGHAMDGYDLSFYWVDLSNSAFIRAFRTPRSSSLIVCQVEDRDLKAVEPVFRAITTSLLNGPFGALT